MPYSVRWLIGLVAVTILTAIAAGAVMYAETRHQTRTTAQAITGGHVTAGQTAIARYGCGSCHDIPGVSGATGRVGPALGGIATRAHIAGVLANDPDQMIRWLQHPQAILPGNGMPDQGVSERDARDMAAYLYTLKR